MPYLLAARASEQNNIAAKLMEDRSIASMPKALCGKVFYTELEEGALRLQCMPQLE